MPLIFLALPSLVGSDFEREVTETGVGRRTVPGALFRFAAEASIGSEFERILSLPRNMINA